MLPCVGFSELHVSVGFKFSNILNVRSTRKVLDNEGRKVTIEVLKGHVSLDDADAIMDVQVMDIPLEKDEQFATKVSRLDVIMVQKNVMESKQSLVVSSEFHSIGVQVSKDTTPCSIASIIESLTIDSIVKAFPLSEQLFNFFQQGSNCFRTPRPIARNLYQELQVAAKAPPRENRKKPQAKVQKKVLFIKGATHIVKLIGKQRPMVPFVVNPPLESSKNDNELLALPIDETLYTDMENSPITTIALFDMQRPNDKFLT
jgi:hypothetical protein